MIEKRKTHITNENWSEIFIFFLIRCFKKILLAKMQNKIVKMLLITKIQAIIIVVSIYILQQNLNRVGCIGTFPNDLHILCITTTAKFPTESISELSKTVQ